MSTELKKQIEEYLSKLPRWRRFLTSGVLSIIMPGTAPKIMGSALFAVLVGVVIIGVSIYIGYEIACTFMVNC